MNVFVTGGTGFIGRYLLKRLLNEGNEVTALVRDEGKGEELKAYGAHIIKGDLTDATTYRDALQGIDIVYHCAALTGFIGISWEQFYEINILGTKKLLDICVEAGCPNIVHVSTTLLYGPSKDDRPRTEVDPAGENISGYEKSKVEAEKIVLSYVKETGLNVKIVRLTTVYGSEGRFIPILVEDMLKNKLNIIGNGCNKKHITHVSDAVEGIILASRKGRSGAIYNIGAKDIPTMNDIVETIANELKVKHPKKIPRFIAKSVAGFMELSSMVTQKPPLHTRYMVDWISLNHASDIQLASKELGFVSKTPFDKGIPSAIHEYMG